MEISEDIISEIFSLLPAKSICKFKSCSKSISKLTQETNFALKQSQHSMIMNDSCFFIQPRSSQSFKLETHALPGEEKSSGVPRNFLQFLTQTSSRILASSNGLLLCQYLKGGSKQLFICNPITKSFFEIPTPNKLIQNRPTFVKFVLECNHNTSVNLEECKLILLVQYEVSSYNYEIETYMKKYGVWKATDGGLSTRGYRGMVCKSPLIYMGDLHLILIDSLFYFFDSAVFAPKIVAHQLDSGTSKFLSLPKEAFDEYVLKNLLDMRIFKWGKAESSNESLCFVTFFKRSIFTIWVLMDYESSSWSKHLTISLEDIIMGLKISDVAIGFTIMNGNSLVFATRSSLYKYDLLVGERNNNNNNKKAEYIMEHGYEKDFIFNEFEVKEAFNVDFISYSPTLQSCGVGATTFSV